MFLIFIQVYNVFSGLEVAHKKELHSQTVTALTFFNPLKYVITGAQDGCSKTSLHLSYHVCIYLHIKLTFFVCLLVPKSLKMYDTYRIITFVFV